MRVIDVENYPRGAIRYIRYLAARRCPRCSLPPVDVFAVPQVGMDEDVIEENFHCEMEYIADVTLAVQARAAGKVEGIALREGKRSRKGA